MTEINQKIFKSYDIRGIYPIELNEAAAYAVGRAFVLYSGVKQVVVGRDMRLGGEVLKERLIAGILDQGADVVDIGLVPIDAVYFAVGKLSYPAGVMITASHNPKEYNGFKMCLPGIKMVRGTTIYEVVKDLPAEKSQTIGKVSTRDIMTEYVQHILSFVDLNQIKSLKVVMDAGNGMAGKVIPWLQKNLPLEIIPLNFELDGNFPAHPSNPLLPESQVQIKEAVVANRADFGVIFDGDTDRLFFVDEKGKFIAADLTLLVLAREFLNREPGAGIVYNVICSKIVPEKIKEWGGRSLRSKVGFANIGDAMRENQGVMGGELSAHYSFRDNYYADSGFIAFLILTQLISQSGRPLSEIVSQFEKYFKSAEINLPITNATEVINQVREKYQAGSQDELDGLTVEYTDWWFNVRPSNTEPLLRVTLEANSEDRLTTKKEELVNFINSLTNISR